MAKNTKGGLGRGLNSLLSGASEEAVAPEIITKEREVVELDEAEKEAVKQDAPKPAKKSIAKEEQNVSRETSASVSKSTASSKKELASKKEGVEEKTSYVEEDDKVVIKEVKERIADEVPLVSVQPNPDQPRTNFKQEEIEELAASIAKEGLLQPILVRPVGKKYQIIAGERRWQACKSLGMKTVPIRVRNADDDKVLELALIENIQRSDLNPIEEAYGYRRMMERQGLTQSEVAEAVSKGRSTVANALRLLELPEQAQQLLFEEKISAGHARAILAIPHKEGRQKLTDKMIQEKISVREAETLARLFSGLKNKEEASARQPMPQAFKKVARSLRETLQTNVRVKTVQGKNKIEIEFKDEEELERLFSLIATED